MKNIFKINKPRTFQWDLRPRRKDLLDFPSLPQQAVGYGGKVRDKGETVLIVIIFIVVVLLFSTALLVYTQNRRITTQRSYNIGRAMNVAEAGLNKAVWCLNHSTQCPSPYNGETATVGDGQYTTTVTSVGQDYNVTSVGTVNNVKKTVKSIITKQVTIANASFYYGVQVGDGGLDMGNNSYIVGNIYSNGSITAGAGAYVTDDVHVAGGTALTTDQQQTTKSSDFSFGDNSSRADIAQSFKPGVTVPINYVNFYIKKVCDGGDCSKSKDNPSNATVRITTDNGNKPATSSLTTGTLDSTLVTTSFNWVNVSFTSNPELTQNQTYWVVIDMLSTSSTKYYVIGKHDNSGYGNGIGLYSADYSGGSWTDAFGDFTFKTWMGGIITKIDGLTVGNKTHTCDASHYATHHGDAYAHQILNSWVECDAFYATDPADIAGTTVGKTKHPGSTDPPPEAMPISDGQITDWKAAAAEGGEQIGDYNLIINGEKASLGPKKITGNMLISNSVELTITGTVWVTGDVTISNNAIIKLDTGYGTNSGVMVVDGKINVSNNCVFQGSGTAGSYILILTTNNSLDAGSPAINIANNAQTVIFYAANGLINIANNAQLKEATGYKLSLSNNASVVYETGLANAKFANGPGGVWAIQSKTWQEVK